MKFILEINMDNAVFDVELNGYEVRNVLKLAERQIDNMLWNWLTPETQIKLHDSNGNLVGWWKVEK